MALVAIGGAGSVGVDCGMGGDGDVGGVVGMVGVRKERGMSEEKEVHSDGCTGAQHYTDGVSWTCFCKAVNLNTFAGAWFLHKEDKNGCEECVPTKKREASHD